MREKYGGVHLILGPCALTEQFQKHVGLAYLEQPGAELFLAIANKLPKRELMSSASRNHR